MPKLQGFEVLRILKQDPATKQIPVVVLSNLGVRETKVGTVDVGQQAGGIAFWKQEPAK